MKCAEYLLRLDAATAQAWAIQALRGEGCRLTWSAPNVALAEQGNRTAHRFLGALSQYYALDVTISASAQGTMLRVTKRNSGWWGGVIGVRLVEKRFLRVTAGLQTYFAAHGRLVSHRLS